MVSDDVTIWVKVEDGGRPRAAISLDVSRTLTIDRLVPVVLKEEKVETAPDLVTVKFGETEIRRDRLVTDFDTTCSYENPLLLKCPDECEGV